MIKVIVTFAVIWILGELYFDNKHHTQLAAESTIEYVDETTPITTFGNYIAKGTIKSTTPAVIPYLVEPDQEALVVDMEVVVFQDCQICTRENKTTRCKYEQKFIAYDSHEWNWQRDWYGEEGKINRNLKKWTLPYKSTQVIASGFIFRDSLLLKNESFRTTLQKAKEQYSYFDLPYPPAKMNDKRRYVDSTQQSKGEYYYGADPKNPTLGDVKITLMGLSSRVAHKYQNFALNGSYKQQGVYSPYYKKYILFSGYTARIADLAQEQVTNHHSGSTNSFRWLFRILLGVVFLIVLVMTIKK